ncbi:5501_t:CDS:2 [Funneliformis geosporum]|uniref:12090_t:CDS:1 n=1 Tax=Funneliformis geosporum TaxID=1117311 RepID=A0A9W4T023_9GLOM|nr:5501_t:CDS:2 [Funneliformis geosporum]CAI2187618.1 12090_t:CDS:2 [Funneliformis geosporum]
MEANITSNSIKKRSKNDVFIVSHINEVPSTSDQQEFCGLAQQQQTSIKEIPKKRTVPAKRKKITATNQMMESDEGCDFKEIKEEENESTNLGIHKLKSTAHAKNSTVPKLKNAWRSEEDKILVDKILEDMPSPSWSKISHCLKDRNPNACLVRWKTLKKRLYQSSQ